MPAPLPVPAVEAARRRAQRRRLRRRVTGLVFAVPLFFLACALYLLLGPKPPPPPSVPPITPQQADQAEQHVDAFRQALTQPEASPAPPPHTSPEAADATLSPDKPKAAPTAVGHAAGPRGEDVVTLQLSQADINAYLAGSKKLKRSLEAKGVHAVSVELTAPDIITFHADASIKGLTGNGLVTATMTPDPKTSVHLDVTDARFGRLPPPIVKAAADQIISRILVSPQHPPSLSVRKVEVRGTDLILTGVESGKAAAP